MKILFCGTILPREFETEITYLSSAANQFQHNLINEMRKQGHEVRILSYVAFPVEQSAVDSLTAKKEENITYVFKQGNIVGSLLLYHQMMKSNMHWADVGLSYNVIYPWIRLSKLSSKFRKRSVLILADFEKIERNCGWKRWIYYHMQVQALQRYDKVVGLTANMREWLLPSQEFMLMEGGIHWEDYEDIQPKKKCDGLVQFMFSGVLSNDKGIHLLLEAIKMVPEEFRLVITGKGPCEQEIHDAAQNDHRIEFLGQVPFEEYLARLKESDVLLNPRDMHYGNNEYNFPSKFLEYLATGNLIITTKFTGWEKFKENAIFIDSDSEQLAYTMRNVLSREYEIYNQCFTINRRVAEEYSWCINTKKILGES